MRMKKPRQRTIYKFSIVIFILIIAGFMLFTTTGQDEIDKPSKINLIERSIRSPMNQDECHHPHLPIDNPEIMKFYKPVKPIDCGNSLDDWVMCEKSVCFIKPEIIANKGEVICSYTDLIRKTDYRVKYGKTTKTKEPYILRETDFVKVACSASNGDSWHGMAIGIRDTLPRNVGNNYAITGMAEPTFFNVLMFGFDSLSRQAFMRKLPKTYRYLRRVLDATVLRGYNIVGDGTPQALVPLLTGYTELELPETRRRIRNAENVDVYPMVWKEYAQSGYVTSFNEDTPRVGTFTYRLNGFAEQPVDHYMRTYYVESENVWFAGTPNCLGHQPDHVVMLNYTKNFMWKYKDVPRFIFSFHGGLSHDSINLVGAADDDVVDWLRSLKEKGIFEDTILIFMADHGNRFSEVRATVQGKQEERLPFFSFAFPKAFQKRFPQQYANFVANADRLTTPFDVHATLKDLLDMQKRDLPQFQQYPFGSGHKFLMETPTSATVVSTRTEAIARQRAISLFAVVPHNRSCADAYIEPHWCACLKWENMPLNDNATSDLIMKLATNIVDTINNATYQFRSRCAVLELKRINWAMRLLPSKAMLKFKQNLDTDGFLADLSADMHIEDAMYQLQIVIAPGDSLFEASVSRNLRDFTMMTKLSDISRINKYGEQANCVYENNPELRKYCYCRDGGKA